MKVKFKYGIATYSGTLDEMTYGNYRNGRICIGRKWVLPKETANNQTLGTIAQNLSEIYALVSADFKGDLKTYARLFGTAVTPKYQLPPNSYGIFTKLMYAFGEANSGSVDLKTITLNDINSLYPEMSTIASIVEEGYLPKLNGVNLLVAEM